MAIRTLAETVAASETWISIWQDDSEDEVYLQYGYVDISMPVEDFRDLVEVLTQAHEKVRESKAR